MSSRFTSRSVRLVDDRSDSDPPRRPQSARGKGRPKPVRPRSSEATGATAKSNQSAAVFAEGLIESLPVLSVSGVLELHPSGYGFLRDPARSFLPERTDPYVAKNVIERFGLREGVLVTASAQQARPDAGPRVAEVHDIDGLTPEQYATVKRFEEATPITPEVWLKLETDPERLTTRVIDLLTPLGKGQRALIVAPPRTGKTTLLKHIGQAITANYPEVTLLVMLIDERPEEVTDMRRSVQGQILASSLDNEVESHVRLSQLAIERAKRLAELGRDVVVVVDSLTRIARAFNKRIGDSGRTMTGGMDVRAMDIPKKLFATARAFEEGGSVTIVATALIDTGSRMDELIFQEFKGTGNMELVLDRQLADRRIWPAIDISLSGTRREEKLLSAETLDAVTALRRSLSTQNPVDCMEQLLKMLLKFPTNKEFVKMLGTAWRDR